MLDGKKSGIQMTTFLLSVVRLDLKKSVILLNMKLASDDSLHRRNYSF